MGITQARDFLDIGRLAALLRGERARKLPLAVLRTGGVFVITGAMGVDLTLRYLLDRGLDHTLGSRHMQRWCAVMCDLFDVQREVTGKPPVVSVGGASFGQYDVRLMRRQKSGAEAENTPRSRGVLMICNHRSYMDIPVVGALLPTVFVSKAELRDWPVIGWGGALAGTIFVDRDDPGSRKQVRDAVLDRLESGLNVLNYPEGTTNDKEGMLPFKLGLFRAVAGADLEIVPVVLKYPPSGETDWAGGMTFVDHLIQTAAGPPVKVTVHFGEPIAARDYPDAVALMEQVRTQMLEQLQAPG